MADEKPSLHIDTDWKRQAQEEKRRLAEEEKRKAQSGAGAATAPPGVAAGTGPRGGTAAPDRPSGAAEPATGARTARELPPASFASIVQTLMTQALFYLGELAPRGGEPVVNLDLAKHHIDMLSVLEEKTRNNLSAEEKRLLDTALYEVRMRYVSVASQYVS